MASSSFSPKLCFNSNCKQVLERSRKGWRRRTGEYADLCDRCASAYEEGKFCDSFHLNASGWRCCESCGKQIHCGCIVSFHMFVLLDAGGIECINCTRKSFILTPNPAWPPPSLVLPGLPDRIKDISVKNWSSIAASGPVPWRQAPSMFNSEMHPKMPFELDIPSGIDRLLATERLSASSLDKKKNADSSERLINGSLKTGASQIFEKGIKCEEQPNPYVNATQQTAFVNNEPSTPRFSLTLTPALKTETIEQTKVSKTHVQRQTPPPAAGKQFCSSNGVDSSGEPQTRNGRPRGDARGRNQLLPRYWPRITDQELQQISGNSNSKITPLFEKMLSASDAGRIGRLVLPKKCAEAYFPPISNPEGIPLMVQDLKGKEWVFQFRFWPNNNSRMYVLEGVTPCIQSMQMQAGDRVTFSRLEPEGKLVMGCRKAFTPPEQCKELINTSNGGSTKGDAIVKATKAGEVVSADCHSKGNPVASNLLAINPENSADPASTWSKVDKSNYIAREALGAKPTLRSKRKYSTLASKSKRLRIENEMIELKVTWEQAQGLFRPPPNDVPKIMMIEGYEIEEFEEPPIIGRPTILAEDHVGEKIQWAQCEGCFKWRKVPRDVLFPSIWTCSKNLWDPQRSHCSAAQELSPEELKDLLSTGNQAGAKKLEADNEELDSLVALEGLDALAYLAIQEEGDALPSSSLATTKHPRHRPGCSCIVCIQPPSGKGHKHKPTCTCNVCLTMKRRFQTLTLWREKKRSEAETASQKLHQSVQLADEEIHRCSDTGTSSPSHKMMIDEGHVDNPINMKSSASPFKGQIDLNIQPERDEDLSPVSDSGGTSRRVLQDAAERYLNKLQKISSSAGNTTSAGSQLHPTGVGVGNFSNAIPLDSSKNGDDHPPTLSATKS